MSAAFAKRVHKHLVKNGFRDALLYITDDPSCEDNAITVKDRGVEVDVQVGETRNFCMVGWQTRDGLFHFLPERASTQLDVVVQDVQRALAEKHKEAAATLAGL